MKTDISIGYVNTFPVNVDDHEVLNGSIVLIGASGSGKSVELQRLACEMVLAGKTVLIISQHGTLADDQILPYYKKAINENRRDMYASEEGIPCSIFTPLMFSDGTSERLEDTIGALADVFARALKLGRRQKCILTSALEVIFEERLFENEGLRALERVLNNMETKGALDLLEILRPILRRTVFRSGNLIEKGCINIVHLEKMDLATQEVLMEILLSYIWRMANADQFKEKELSLFLDESQNIAQGAKSPLSLMLSEGRKMGINLILATQLISSSSRDSAQQRMFQAGLVLFFKPAASQVSATAKLISAQDDGRWNIKLRTLKIGEFIALGNFLVDGKPVCYPLKVDANVDKIKDFEGEKKYHIV